MARSQSVVQNRRQVPEYDELIIVSFALSSLENE
jgi:hypothetical protein